MLTLVTGNPAKYEPFARDLERWRICLEPPRGELYEIQAPTFADALAAKARAAAAMFGRPVLVDDAGVVFEAFKPFPGPLTSSVVPVLGATGLRRLLGDAPNHATFECHLGCWVGGALRHWSGIVPGRLDFSVPVRNPRLPMSDWFVPDAPGSPGAERLGHRARALAALGEDIFDLHLDLAPEPAACVAGPGHQCPFCAELQGDGLNLFAEMTGGSLPSRIVYEDEHFIVMPPLGEFMEGGLLLLTREHIVSFAHLRPDLLAPLERLLAAIRRALAERWGTAPLIFEHGPAPDRGKGVCCVDHAHFNIFPAPVRLHPHLAARLHKRMDTLADLPRLRRAESGYLLVQENDGTRRAYDGQDVPTQLVRRIITTALGFPERWHWREYPGQAELLATYHALKGRLRP